MNAMRNFFRNRFKISEERLAICKKCDKYDHRTTQCSECGCFMAAKTLLPNVSCPLNKWSEFVNPEEDINKE